MSGAVRLHADVVGHAPDRCGYAKNIQETHRHLDLVGRSELRIRCVLFCSPLNPFGRSPNCQKDIRDDPHHREGDKDHYGNIAPQPLQLHRKHTRSSFGALVKCEMVSESIDFDATLVFGQSSAMRPGCRCTPFISAAAHRPNDGQNDRDPLPTV